MPKQHAHVASRFLHVELEVTPNWWSQLGGKSLGCRESETSQRSADTIARSLLMVMGVFDTCEVRVSRSALKLLVMVPTDATLEVLIEKAGQLRERMNALVPVG